MAFYLHHFPPSSSRILSISFLPECYESSQISFSGAVTYVSRIHGTVDGTDFEDKRVSTVTLALDDKIYQPVTHVDKTDTKQVMNEDMKAAPVFRYDY